MAPLNNKIVGFFKVQANVPSFGNGVGLHLDLVTGSDGQPHLHRSSTASILSRFSLRETDTTAVSLTSLKELAIEHPLLLATEDSKLAELLATELKPGPQTIWLASSSLQLCTIFAASPLPAMHLAGDKVCGEKHANALHKQRIPYAVLPKQVCTKGTIALYKKFSVEVFVSNLVQLREMAQAVEAGAKGLISTNKDNLVATIQEHKAR